MTAFDDDVNNDLRSILAAEFTDSASITVNTGVNLPAVAGIFDATFLDVDEAGAPIQSTFQQFGCHIGDIDAALGFDISEDNTRDIIIDSEKYRLDHVERDGTGFGRLILKFFEGKNPFVQAP